MAVRTAQLPGIRFDIQPPSPSQVLPRMDIAAFVGFAASGPLHVPVPVEDMAQFEAIFGGSLPGRLSGDLPLAWDEVRGAYTTAYLGPAVRAFFRGGGRRCYVIRVAGAARENRFPIPGLLRVSPAGRLAPAYARARSEGSWSDELRCGCETLIQPLTLKELRHTGDPSLPFEADLLLSRPSDLIVGDLLRLNLRCGESSYQLLFTPPILEEIAQPSGKPLVRVRWKDGHWLRLPGPTFPAKEGRVRIFNSTNSALRLKPQCRHQVWTLNGLKCTPVQPVELMLDLTLEETPEPGCLVEVLFAGQRLWLVILSVRAQFRPKDNLDHPVIEGVGAWESTAPANWYTAGQNRSIERLRMRLAVRQASQPASQRMLSSELGFSPGHSAYWNALPSDASLYARERTNELPKLYDDLWQAAAQPRFPLAGHMVSQSGTPENLFIPLPLPAGADLYTGPLYQPGTTLERSGLADFSVDLFLDPLLHGYGTDSLVAQADYLSYQSPVAHQPKGIYAALRLDEVTLIAAPDALHTGWRRNSSSPPEPKVEQPLSPDLPCEPPLPIESFGQFVDSSILSAPLLTINPPPLAGGSFKVSWVSDGSAVSGKTFRLEEAIVADFTGAVTIYYGAASSFDIPARSPGAYYYRVREERKTLGLFGRWSEGVGLRVGVKRPWASRTSSEYNETDLTRFHSSLLRMCAARGDLFAVLDLPAHFYEDQALRYVNSLTQAFSEIDPHAASFGAIYHPWIYAHEEDRAQVQQAILVPPSGPLLGMIAKRTLARGAWLSPANEPLTGVLAAEPQLQAARYLDLQEGRINIICREPRGFLVMHEATLSNDPDLELIHVRRLLMQIRRLALREGATYVFEPNSPAFRRQVQRGFEDMLTSMFRAGAFAGATTASSFQVDVSERVNSPASVDLGRLVVEIRVAPSQPLVFLTIRLVQTGPRELSVHEGPF